MKIYIFLIWTLTGYSQTTEPVFHVGLNGLTDANT